MSVPEIVRAHDIVLGPDSGKRGQVCFNLAPDAAERDTEHALAAL